MRYFLTLALVVSLCLPTPWADDPPELRAAYVPVWDLRTQSGCDSIIANVLASNLNAVFVQVRARGDAYYFPNREDSTYPNPEPRGLLYSISPANLDCLQYLIDRLHTASPPVEVHAWCTTYNVWNRTSDPGSSNHLYLAHPEWLTENSSGSTVNYPVVDPNSEPALDPGIPAVQDYLYNVFMDIVRNYDVDGIHFDYIRLLSSNSGYDPVALAQFQAETGFSYNPASPGSLGEVYEAWRRDQIAQLVQRVHARTQLEKPWVEVSAFLVNFADSVEVLGQGYNWWVAHGAIDVLHPGCYSSSVSGTISDWNFYVSKLAQNGDQNTRPMVAAIGSYLLDVGENVTVVNSLRANARPAQGFNFFDQGSLFVDGTPANALASALFNTGGPMDDWAPVPGIPHKSDEESLPPNAPASLSVTLEGGLPRVTFNRPAAAGDGDLPVHYRLYHDTKTPVDLYYSNRAMEWWDLGSTRTSFTFLDPAPPSGSVYYAAVAYDDWNNEAVATQGPVTPSGGAYIVETRSGGQHISDYSEPAGSFSNSTAHSTAPGCTPGIGSRWATPGSAGESRGDRARFTPSALASGVYDVAVTTFNYSSANAQNVTVRISDADGTSTTLYDLTAAAAGNQWDNVGTLNFTAGQGHYVEFDNTTQTNFGDSTNSRMAATAVRLVRQSAATKETKPPVSEATSSINEVIVDSEPTALNYDDSDSSSAWQTTDYSPSGTLYGGTARYYHSDNYPMDDYAVWVVDLPRSGQWAIDGWIRGEQGSLAQGVQYRFVDGTMAVRSSVATLRTGSSGWTIDVDGVSDVDAYYFNKGRVYVTLYGNTTGSEMILADALRFRLLSAEASLWQMH